MNTQCLIKHVFGWAANRAGGTIKNGALGLCHFTVNYK